MSDQSWLATAGVVPFDAQPSRNFPLSEAISEWIFLPMAFRRSSASAGEKPATFFAISIDCSWYRLIPYVELLIYFCRSSMYVTCSVPFLRRAYVGLISVRTWG